MKFRSKAERLAHPLARLVPKEVWLSLFSEREIDTIDLVLMEQKPDEILAKAATFGRKGEELATKAQQTYALFYYQYPHLPIADYITLGKKLGLDENEIFILSIICDHETLFNEFISRDEMNLKDPNLDFVYDLGMKIGLGYRPKLCKTILRKHYLPFINNTNADIVDTRFDILNNICLHGHIDILKILMVHDDLALKSRLTTPIDENDTRLLDSILTSAFNAGHIEVVRHLSDLSPQSLIKLFNNAIANTQPELLYSRHAKELFDFLKNKHPNKKPEEISSLQLVQQNQYAFFISAAAQGDLSFLNECLSYAPNLTQEMVASRHFRALSLATANQHLGMVNKLLDLMPQQLNEMNLTTCSNILLAAMQHDESTMLDCLIKHITPKRLIDALQTDHYKLLLTVAKQRNLYSFERVLTLLSTPQEMKESKAIGNTDLQNMLLREGYSKQAEEIDSSHDKFSILIAYASKGEVTRLQNLLDQAGIRFQDIPLLALEKMLKTAALNGQKQMVDWLLRSGPIPEINLLPKLKRHDTKPTMTPVPLEALSAAKKYGHCEIVNILSSYFSSSPQLSRYSQYFDKTEMHYLYVAHAQADQTLFNLYLSDYTILNYAFTNPTSFGGELSENAAKIYAKFIQVRDQFEEKHPNEVFTLTNPDHLHHYPSLFRYYLKFYPTLYKDNTHAIFSVRDIARLSINAYFSMTHNLSRDLEYNLYSILKTALEHGDFILLDLLFQHFTINEIDSTITTSSFFPIDALLNDAMKYPVFFDKILSIPSIFNNAEEHQAEYGLLVDRYITVKMANLKVSRTTFEEKQPNDVFNLENANEAKEYFYILRRLIRRNSPTVLDDIRMLLDIPSVKAILHTPVSEGRSNELLRLALSVQNTEAITLLLNIPTVRNLARENQYYQEEQTNSIDLATLAQNRESSMAMLSSREQKQLNSALKHYQPIIRSKTPEAILSELKITLQNLYRNHPAVVLVNNNPISLPIRYEDFHEIKMDDNTRGLANQAYYQNKYHTALRYLSNPNLWMSPKASYVYISDDRRHRWSTFEEYLSLISLFYLAAIDPTIQSDAEWTPAARLEQFIDELAHIGRAHNWDSIRTRLTDKGTDITEEYDDLDGDRPSCYSGVKRRLFQSVLHHPMFSILTKEIMKKEIDEFVREHYSRLIKLGNKEIALHWNNVVIELSETDSKALAKWDINTTLQKQFIKAMLKKYPNEFDNGYKKQIENAFKLKGTERFESHFAKFHGRAHLDPLIKTAINEVDILKNILVEHLAKYEKEAKGRIKVGGLFHRQNPQRIDTIREVLRQVNDEKHTYDEIRSILVTTVATLKTEHKHGGRVKSKLKSLTRSKLEKAISNTLETDHKRGNKIK